MSKLALTLHGGGPGAAGKIVAQLQSRSSSGRAMSKTVVLELGGTTTVDVDPGHVVVQVRLPSGDLLTDERVVGSDRDEAITFGVKTSRHEWLGWQNVLSPEAADQAYRDPEFPVAEPWIAALRVHRPGAPILEVPLDGGAVDGTARYAVHMDAQTLSLTIEGYDRQPPCLELVHVDGSREVVALPLPWYDDATPLPVQVITELCPTGTRADVIVHDPAFSPVLAYYAAGNLAAARDVAPFIVDRAEAAVMHKFANPVAGAAGVLVLRRLAPKKLPEQWLQNLAGIHQISDGAILYATYLMTTRDRRTDRSRVRKLLLEARKRGAPIFAECGRMLRDALSRLASVERDDPEIADALGWARNLVDASRSDTIITWLSADDRTLSSIVPQVVPPPSP